MWVGLFVALLACFSGIPIGLQLTRPPEVNGQNCRVDGILPAHTVVLIDQSDPFDQTDVDWAWQLIFDEAQALRKNGRLTVIGINEEDPDEGIQVFSRCSPGSPKSANPIFENPQFIRMDWEDKFEKFMRLEVSELMLNKQSPVSPLAEHIRGIQRRSDFRDTVGNRRIVVISDLYQNSNAYSMYNSGLNRKKFKTALETMEFPDLEGVTVALFRVDRKRQLKGSDLIQFWTTVLGEDEHAIVEVIRD
ncbi:hypothetical protein HJA_17607 [Hyphomonas jannaschiana VP2]|uniref:Uncharacterized protein n=2 Tax=Hyphomonas jannaschiana TaxID=86 RepID=A0A059F5Q0_9PROT|nr:hypothetical protein HJA_17607 [Hyphomonas jannaschiana VP2]